jgi:hypothetical protein
MEQIPAAFLRCPAEAVSPAVASFTVEVSKVIGGPIQQMVHAALGSAASILTTTISVETAATASDGAFRSVVFGMVEWFVWILTVMEFVLKMKSAVVLTAMPRISILLRRRTMGRVLYPDLLNVGGNPQSLLTGTLTTSLA